MLALSDIFDRHAPLPPEAREDAEAADTDTGSEAETGGLLTLEYRDNPFASLIRRIDRLAETDPAGAFELARTALLEKTFRGRAEERLEDKLREIAVLMKPDTGGVPRLGRAFVTSVLHLPLPDRKPFFHAQEPAFRAAACAAR